MSNFICAKCGRANIEVNRVWVQGCNHYHPEKDDEYLCTVEDETDKIILIYKNNSWINIGNNVLTMWEELC